MTLSEILLIVTSVVLPVLSGIGSYFMSTKKAQKDIDQLREQNKFDLEKLMNQHKMDLEALERKHQMEVEKMDLEHKHKIELMQQETGNKLGGDLVSQMISGAINSPEVKSYMSKSLLQGMTQKKKK
jgi:lantibiotic modifying enzyme